MMTAVFLLEFRSVIHLMWSVNLFSGASWPSQKSQTVSLSAETGIGFKWRRNRKTSPEKSDWNLRGDYYRMEPLRVAAEGNIGENVLQTSRTTQCVMLHFLLSSISPFWIDGT